MPLSEHENLVSGKLETALSANNARLVKRMSWARGKRRVAMCAALRTLLATGASLGLLATGLMLASCPGRAFALVGYLIIVLSITMLASGAGTRRDGRATRYE